MTGFQEWKEPQEVCDAPGQKQGPPILNKPDVKKKKNLHLRKHLSFPSVRLFLQ